MKRAVRIRGALPNDRPYSPAIELGAVVWISGQLGIMPTTGAVSGGDIRSQTRQALENVRALLVEIGLDLNDVVKTTVFLIDMADFKQMNEVYGGYFQEPHPARSTIAVKALSRREYRVEIEAMALRS